MRPASRHRLAHHWGRMLVWLDQRDLSYVIVHSLVRGTHLSSARCSGVFDLPDMSMLKNMPQSNLSRWPTHRHQHSSASTTSDTNTDPFHPSQTSIATTQRLLDLVEYPWSSLSLTKTVLFAAFRCFMPSSSRAANIPSQSLGCLDTSCLHVYPSAGSSSYLLGTCSRADLISSLMCAP